MRFPKYQWMQEEPINDSCGFCDVLYKTQNSGDDAFQVILDTVNVMDNKFTSNPFDLITSNNLTFDVTSVGYVMEFQLYIGANVYLLRYGTTSEVNYEYNKIDNVYFVTIKYSTLLATKLNLRQFLIDVVDVNHGTTSSLSSSTFTVANIPSGSYVSNNAFADTVNTVTASTNVSKWFYWNSGKLNYSFTNEIADDDRKYKFEQSLTSGLLNIIKFDYNSVSTTFTLQITIDDGISTPTVYNPTVGTGGIIQLEYTPINTGTHTIELILTDPNAINNGFDLSQISITTLNEVVSLEVEDCNGTVSEFEYGYVYLDDVLDGNIMLFNLVDTYPDVFRFIITDSAENTLTSRWYKVADKDDCTNGKLYSVKWTNGCNLGEIDYSVLPFTNELLLSGVLLKSDTDLIDSVENITASGRKISIYKNTQSVYEFRMHPYLSDTFETILEGIFAHDTVTIDGIEYNTTDKVQVSELDLGVYTGRVDLYKDGTNLITKNCC